MRTADVIAAVEALADPGLAESWDNVGLLVGARGDGAETGRVLLCIDLTPDVAREAVELGCGLVLTYHPPIFKPITALTDADWKGAALLALARAGVAVYSPHTALDAAPNGLNDWLAAGLANGSAVTDLRPIAPHPPDHEHRAYKIVVFVPAAEPYAAAAVSVREAMAAAGAGVIGNYRECSIEIPSSGGFRPLDNANPTIGAPGRREEVAEVRLEMAVTHDCLHAVITAARQAHPYEEPAIDVFEQAPVIAHALTADLNPGPPVGPGRLLTLDAPVDAATLAQRARHHLDLPRVRLAGHSATPVTTIALCVGAGGSLFDGLDADAYVTGELSHHAVLDLAQRGKAVVLAGHTNTERPYLSTYAARLVQATGGAVEALVSRADANPWAEA